MIGYNLIAIDGCMLPSDAAKEWSGTLEELEQKRVKLCEQITRKLAEHEATDKTNAKSADVLKAQRFRFAWSCSLPFCSIRTTSLTEPYRPDLTCLDMKSPKYLPSDILVFLGMGYTREI